MTEEKEGKKGANGCSLLKWLRSPCSKGNDLAGIQKTLEKISDDMEKERQGKKYVTDPVVAGMARIEEEIERMRREMRRQQRSGTAIQVIALGAAIGLSIVVQGIASRSGDPTLGRWMIGGGYFIVILAFIMGVCLWQRR